MRVVNPKEDDFRISVEFNRKEAEIIRTICEAIGGDQAGPRGTADELARILNRAGVNHRQAIIDIDRCSTGTLYLKQAD